MVQRPQNDAPLPRSLPRDPYRPETSKKSITWKREVAEGMGLTSNLLQYKSLILFDTHSCYAGRAGVRPQRLALS